MERTILSLFHLLILGILGGCATAPKNASLVDGPEDVPSAQESLAGRLDKIQPGTSLADFRAAFPDSYVRAQRGSQTAYEIVRVQKFVTQQDINRQNFWVGFGSPQARSVRQTLWFYFYQDVLVQWGQPNDWPPAPDKIIEIRQR
jgi:hypothetical protein